jgi:hypothetical protein
VSDAPAAEHPTTTTAHQQRRLACLAALQGGQAGEQRSTEPGAQVSAGASHAERENRNRVLTAE